MQTTLAEMSSFVPKEIAMRNLITVLLFAALSLPAATATFNEVSGAIRENDLDQLHHLVQSSEAANVANSLQVTPLHYAALYGSPEALALLLEAGGNPNASNQSDVTPLVYAAWSFERTRLLVEHGATVNVATNQAITPLMVAVSLHGNTETVRYLLDKGADLKVVTPRGQDALMRAAAFGDADTVKLLLERGADAKRKDKVGFNALLAADSHTAGTVRALLDAGSDPNAFNAFGGMVKNGPIGLVHITPLMLATPYGDEETISLLIKVGARINETDSRKMTPLMFAIATDRAKPTTVARLVSAGADVQAKDKYGDSVLDWANKFQNPEIVSMLVAAGAKRHTMAAAPVPPEHADSGSASGGCAGCHHQPVYARAYAAARNANLPADPNLGVALRDAQMAERPNLYGTLPFLTTFGGDYDILLSRMVANAELAEPANSFSDLMVHFIANRQDASGGWVSAGIARPPIEDSNISRTAYAIQTLTHYGWPARKGEFDERVKRARRWLEQAKPETSYEYADRIFGLEAAGATVSELRADADQLLKLQRDDGGWAQTRYLKSDSYATGIVLDTLFKAGLLKESEPPYQRGVAFLMRTQFPDGSWYVRSRAPKFQPYFQSGFPFDHDQWISSTGSAWAAMALSHAAGGSLAAAKR